MFIVHAVVCVLLSMLDLCCHSIVTACVVTVLSLCCLSIVTVLSKYWHCVV